VCLAAAASAAAKRSLPAQARKVAFVSSVVVMHAPLQRDSGILEVY
jgi:hypothetical protein